MTDTYPVYEQHFEVVLMRRGVSEDAAKPEDFVRVAVTARDQVQALLKDEVKAAAGTEYNVVLAAPPGVQTGPEIMARRRVQDVGAGSRTTNW